MNKQWVMKDLSIKVMLDNGVNLSYSIKRFVKPDEFTRLAWQFIRGAEIEVESLGYAESWLSDLVSSLTESDPNFMPTEVDADLKIAEDTTLRFHFEVYNPHVFAPYRLPDDLGVKR